jgi:hypothetical protein
MKAMGSMEDGSRPWDIMLANMPCIISGFISGIPPGIPAIGGAAAGVAAGTGGAPGIGGIPIVMKACISSICRF